MEIVLPEAPSVNGLPLEVDIREKVPSPEGILAGKVNVNILLASEVTFTLGPLLVNVVV
jgi:hypothetical protein